MGVAVLVALGIFGAPSTPPRVQADRHEQAALRFVKQGKASEACAEYQQSFDAFARARTALAVGRCLAKAGKSIDARTQLAAAEDLARKEKNNAVLKAAAKEREAVEKKLARLSFNVGSEGTHVTVDDVAVATDHPTFVLPGTHVVAASADGRKGWSTSIELDPHDDRAVSIPVLEPTDQPAKDQPAKAPPAAPPPPPSKPIGIEAVLTTTWLAPSMVHVALGASYQLDASFTLYAQERFLHRYHDTTTERAADGTILSNPMVGARGLFELGHRFALVPRLELFAPIGSGGGDDADEQSLEATYGGRLLDLAAFTPNYLTVGPGVGVWFFWDRLFAAVQHSTFLQVRTRGAQNDPVSSMARFSNVAFAEYTLLRDRLSASALLVYYLSPAERDATLTDFWFASGGPNLTVVPFIFGLAYGRTLNPPFSRLGLHFVELKVTARF